MLYEDLVFKYKTKTYVVGIHQKHPTKALLVGTATSVIVVTLVDETYYLNTCAYLEVCAQ